MGGLFYFGELGGLVLVYAYDGQHTLRRGVWFASSGIFCACSGWFLQPFAG